MILARLAISNLSTGKVRTGLTVTAIALAVALVAAVTTGYASAEAAIYRFVDRYVGSTDVQITRRNTPGGGVPESIISTLANDPRVRTVAGRLRLRSTLLDDHGEPLPGAPAVVVGVDRTRDLQLEAMPVESGRWFTAQELDGAMIDQVLASEKLKVKPGDVLRLPGLNGEMTLRVSGIVRQPSFVARHVSTIYLSLATLQRLSLRGDARQVSEINIDLSTGTDISAFAEALKAELTSRDPQLMVRATTENREELDRNLGGFRILSYLGGTVSMLSATFIIFATMSMGVVERQRTLAMLRAVGALRGQIGRLVIGEGMTMALLGALIGVPLGLGLIALLASLPKFSPFFVAGVVPSWGGMAYGTAAALLAALAASLLPAWGAMRVSPLEAMSPHASPPRGRLPLMAAIVGLVLIAIDPLLLWGPVDSLVRAMGITNAADLTKAIRLYGHLSVGVPSVMLGFFLLSPLLVIAIERIFAPMAAALFSVRTALLRQQLSGGVWRAAGTCTALMVGLATLIVMQTQGNTVLNAFRLPDKFPDLLIVSPTLIPFDAQPKLDAVPGVKEGEVMPIAIASPQLGTNLFALLGAQFVPDATMFFGADPDRVFKLMELEFRDEHGRPLAPDEQARAAEAARLMLKRGRHVVVTEEFRKLKGFKTGDKLPIRLAGGQTVDYTIAGIIWPPGLDVIVSRFDMGRQAETRTAGMVFGTIEDARRDFGVEGVNFYVANLDYFVKKEQLLEDVTRVLGKRNLQAIDARQVKHDMQQAFARVLLLMSTVAFAAMAIASLGVTNTVMAGIRTRTWQLGILRSLGLTRSALLRLILAEATLLGIAAASLGLMAGFYMEFNAKTVLTQVNGLDMSMVVPWRIIGIGALAVLLIALMASLFPAWRTSRATPLDLLRAGRASA